MASWVEGAVGIVSGDGTIVLYGFGPPLKPYHPTTFNVTLLHPGDAAWTMCMPKGDLSASTHTSRTAAASRIETARSCYATA